MTARLGRFAWISVEDRGAFGGVPTDAAQSGHSRDLTRVSVVVGSQMGKRRCAAIHWAQDGRSQGAVVQRRLGATLPVDANDV